MTIEISLSPLIYFIKCSKYLYLPTYLNLFVLALFTIYYIALVILLKNGKVSEILHPNYGGLNGSFNITALDFAYYYYRGLAFSIVYSVVGL